MNEVSCRLTWVKILVKFQAVQEPLLDIIMYIYIYIDLQGQKAATWGFTLKPAGVGRLYVLNHPPIVGFVVTILVHCSSV